MPDPDPRAIRNCAGAETAQALTCLAPAALLFAGVLYGVPTHTSSAAGWILIATLPGVALALVRRQRLQVRGLPCLVLLLGLALLHVGRDAGLDSFEARRAVMTLSSSMALIACAATLGPAGRRVMGRGFIALSALGLSVAWIDTLIDPVRSFAGVLENSGDLSETVLPGALLGYASGRALRGTWRLAALATALGFLFTAGWVPVLAGGSSFLVAASLAALLGRSFGRHTLPLAILAFGAGLFISPHTGKAASSDTAGEAANSSVAGNESRAALGGVAFRKLTWARVPHMVIDRPWIGVGPGQFPRTFPPYRDPREIELSSHGRRSPDSTEVEHAHSDWLEAFAEYGLIGGLAWLAFGILAAARAMAVITRSPDATGIKDPGRAAYAVACLGLLANAAFNSPFFDGPAFAVAAPLLGALLGPTAPVRASGGLARLPALAIAGLLATQAAGAWNFVRHGAALAPLAGEATVVVDGRRVHSAEAKARAVERALAACPDSTVARVERAHLKHTEGAAAEEQLALWRAVLELRPHHFEALMAAANVLARLEKFDAAREHYARAAEVDGANPILERNRLLLALRAGHVGDVLSGLARGSEQGTLDPEWLKRCAAELLLSGRPHLGLPLLERAAPELRVTTAEEAYGLANTVESRLLADALLAHANFSWAREHAAAGDAASAVRSYRQCLSVAARYPDLRGGARRVRLELAAALSLRGQGAEASALIQQLTPSPVDLRELPGWASDELHARGWIPPREP